MAPVTLNDVAIKAGVSKKTVSRVLNKEPNVSTETLHKVQEAISELNYVPNTSARRLSSGRAKTIGVILGWQIFTPYTSKLLEGVFKESHRLGYSISLFPMANESAENIIHAYRGKQVDGFILDTPSAMAKRLMGGLDNLEVPYVVINPNTKTSRPNASYVRIDDKLAAQLGTEYLIQLGHRHIGMVIMPNGMNHITNRLMGYKNALKATGIDFREELVTCGDTPQTFESGVTCSLKLIDQYPEVTAIFALTDDIAMGVMKALWQLGKKIPQDVSVLGFDDNHYAAMTSPPLTTIHQPIAELACEAVRLLAQKLDDPLQESKEVVLPTHLEIRDSCAPLPHATLR